MAVASFREIRDFALAKSIRGKGLGLVGWLAALTLFTALMVAQAVSAQSSTPPSPITDNDVNRVAHQLYCPVCESIPLDVCPTQACIQWRATIREKLTAGWSDQQIIDYFVAQYGERVLARPSTHGLNVLVWVIPPVLLLGGAGVLWRILRQMQQAKASAAPAASSSPAAMTARDEYRERLEQELRKRI